MKVKSLIKILPRQSSYWMEWDRSELTYFSDNPMHMRRIRVNIPLKCNSTNTIYKIDEDNSSLTLTKKLYYGNNKVI